jgi:very-short-patch-repair endonuclease
MQWAEITRRQGGFTSRRQLMAAGVDPRNVEDFVRAGRLERTSARGVYRAAGAPWVDDSDAWFAVLATGSPLSYLSAARWWEISVPPDGWVHITRFERRRLEWPRGIRVHRVALAPSAVTEHRGLLVTSRSETMLDCLGWLPLGTARGLADRAAQQGWLRADDIERRLDELPGRWGNRQLRRLLPQFTDGADAESERRLHRLLRTAGFTGWVAQLPVVAGGQRFYLDVAFPSQRLAIEVDGYEYHRATDRFQADRTRQNALIAAGWRVLRFTWADLKDRPEYVIGRIGQLLAA